MTYKTEITLSGAAGLKQREINNVIRESMEAIGWYWRKFFLKKHFTHAGGREYKYTPRKTYSNSPGRMSYVQRKKKAVGHTLPLVLSGEGRDEAKRMRKVKAVAYKGHARVTIGLPRKFNRQNKTHSKVRMVDEIRAVSEKERKTLNRVLRDNIVSGLEEKGERNVAVAVSIT